MFEPKARRHRNGSVTYYIRARYLGVDLNYALGTSDLKEARRLSAEVSPVLMQRVKDGQLKSGSFAAVAAQYVASGKSDRFLAPLIKAFGQAKLNDITDDDVKQWANRQSWRGKPWANQTKNRQAITPFEAVANFGARQSPPICRPRKLEAYPEGQRVITAAPDAWIRWVVPLTVDRRPQLGALIVFMTTTAVRISEALRLDWRDVDLDDASAVIRKTKSGQPRQVKLAPSVVAAFTHIRPDVARGRVFSRYASRWSVTTAIKRLCDAHGQPYYSTHQWGRHAFAERLLRMNKSLLMVKDAGGWSSLKVVVDSYGHLERTHVETTVLEGAEAFDDADPVSLKIEKD